MEAYGYVRVSTIGQVDGEGLGVQRDRIESWCSYQRVPLKGLFEDAGISGASTDNRPGFIEAISKVLELGERAVFVVSKLDRLGRNSIDVQRTLASLIEAGVRVVAINDGVDSGSGMGNSILKLLTTILASFAELEKDVIRSRLMDGRKRADKGNRVYSSEPRYGRRVGEDGSTLVEVPEELATIKRVKVLRERGLSFRDIGKALLKEGLRPRRARAWSPAVVRRLVLGSRGSSKARCRRTVPAT
jgi:DNA invertase Pin-like site-specific DNA recombinase